MYEHKYNISICVRTVSDYHLQEIAKHCHSLEQLDILGTNNITSEGISK